MASPQHLRQAWGNSLAVPRVRAAKKYTLLWIDFLHLLYFKKYFQLVRGDLAAHNLAAFDALGRVASIDHQLSFVDDATVVVVGVIGHDDHAVVLTQIL